LQRLSKTKNLLAFSGGVDSTALFFMLEDFGIKFDIAIVDYGTRKQSKDEVNYAKTLSKQYNKKCFTKKFPKDIKFSEKKARDFRYEFFQNIILEQNYDILLTAHQLNDKFEWFLMQISKGAGLVELIGLQEFEKKQNYSIFRPLLGYSKQQLQDYLDKKQIKYFIDKTNFDTKYKRNYFRQKYSDMFLQEFETGVRKSFGYLQKDKDSLLKNISVFTKEKLKIYDIDTNDENIIIKIIDKELKNRGILITKATRDEIIRQKNITISDKISISIQQNKIYIAPKCQTPMTKKFKETCRKNNIPKNIRSYLFEIGFEFRL
jgi:tRNA(Ile)-lysidine synthase